jgi:hypothetical protein
LVPVENLQDFCAGSLSRKMCGVALLP